MRTTETQDPARLQPTPAAQDKKQFENRPQDPKQQD